MNKWVVMIVFLLVSINGFAETLQVGQRISPFKLENQYGKYVSVDDKAKIIFFTKEKVPSNYMLNSYLSI